MAGENNNPKKKPFKNFGTEPESGHYAWAWLSICRANFGSKTLFVTILLRMVWE